MRNVKRWHSPERAVTTPIMDSFAPIVERRLADVPVSERDRSWPDSQRSLVMVRAGSKSSLVTVTLTVVA